MTKVSLIIPCYNESGNLRQLVKRCAEVFINQPVELILVDNGSVDKTPEILAELLPQYSFIKSVRVEKNQGYGYGILYGLAHAQSPYIGWTHADLQTDPADILKILPLLDTMQESLFIKGKRSGRHIFDLFFTVGMSFFETLLLTTRLWDINAQPTIMPKTFFNSWTNPPHDFSLDLYAYYMAKKLKLKVVRIPVFFGKRVAGEAHLKDLKAKLKYCWRTITYSWKLRLKLSKANAS